MSIAYFPTLIYEVELDVDNVSLHKKSMELYNNRTTVNTNWFCDTFNTIGIYDITKDPLFSQFVETCMQHTRIFSKDYGISNAVIKSKEGWINVAMQNDYQEFHLHPNNHFSMVYYVSVPENSGNIIFRSPESNTDMFQLPFGNETIATMKTATIKAKTGKLIIFRSNLLHMVEKNKSNSERVSISMNVVLEDK